MSGLLAQAGPSFSEVADLLPRLALVGAAVAGASLAARRGGHRVAGWITGLPVIIGPLMAMLLLDQPALRVAAIAQAALISLPATLLHSVVFAWAAQRVGWRWPACLGAALAAYLVVGAALHRAWALGPDPSALLSGGSALGCLALLGLPLLPAAARRALPALAHHATAQGPVSIPAREVVWRTLAALAVAAAVLLGAPRLPSAWSGLLVAVPIAGSVLPCFTLPLHGPAATVHLLRGFLTGMHGFAAFLATLVVALPLLAPALAWSLAVVATVAASSLVKACSLGRRP